jgi:Family of unknown function (DUF7009)
MKLRIQNDSLRLRLTRSEVARIARGLPVESTCRFPDDRALTYALVITDEPALGSTLASGRIEVSVPRAAAAQWADSNDVALGAAPQQIGRLQILIEKDFACVVPRDGEDPADFYPNPKAHRRED